MMAVWSNLHVVSQMSRSNLLLTVVVCVLMGSLAQAETRVVILGTGTPVPDAAQIHDVVAQRFLTIELQALDLFPAHPRPKQALGLGHVFTQFAGGLFEIFVVGFQ